ncbi:hypothetical protein OG390_27040 [Streptomyces sp. NBC_00996]|nr:hypothetical protein OG390_27040 [Streptomyces sp. NBC_00996]
MDATALLRTLVPPGQVERADPRGLVGGYAEVPQPAACDQVRGVRVVTVGLCVQQWAHGRLGAHRHRQGEIEVLHLEPPGGRRGTDVTQCAWRQPAVGAGHFEPTLRQDPAELRAAPVQAAGHTEALGVRDAGSSMSAVSRSMNSPNTVERSVPVKSVGGEASE